LPAAMKTPEDILYMLQVCNPNLPMKDWRVVKVEEHEGDENQAVMGLNKESVAPIEAARGKLNFGFSAVQIKIYKGDFNAAGNSESNLAEQVPPITQGSCVKSAKHLFLRTVGEDILTAEELGTLLTSVEAVLNSRPLGAISTDPNDGEALSPGHLLIGGPLLAPPSAALPNQVSPTCLRRWRSVSSLMHRFWQRWSREYVSSLQAKNKWHQEVPNVDVGALVVVAEENLPPQQWMIGRI
ncbi:hypothetical protein KR084_011485, partial [Drosophila pseudotakahashii]